MQTFTMHHNSPLGWMEITLLRAQHNAEALHGIGISKLSVLDDSPETPQQSLPQDEHGSALAAQICREMDEYFAGTRQHFTVPLMPQGTAFEQRVWAALQEIQYGTTYSYSQLTEQLGDMKAIRAVAAANGRNPLWILIPCHRVIGKNGAMTGYAGGIWRKEWLLRHEGALSQEQLF